MVLLFIGNTPQPLFSYSALSQKELAWSLVLGLHGVLRFFAIQ
jgi:hypothetical protein